MQQCKTRSPGEAAGAKRDQCEWECDPWLWLWPPDEPPPDPLPPDPLPPDELLPELLAGVLLAGGVEGVEPDELPEPDDSPELDDELSVLAAGAVLLEDPRLSVL